jgi:hypothetical protein
LLIKTPRWEKPKRLITFREYIAIHRRHRPKDQEGPEALPGTLRRGESPPKVFFIAMLASGAMSE